MSSVALAAARTIVIATGATAIIVASATATITAAHATVIVKPVFDYLFRFDAVMLVTPKDQQLQSASQCQSATLTQLRFCV